MIHQSNHPSIPINSQLMIRVFNAQFQAEEAMKRAIGISLMMVAFFALTSCQKSEEETKLEPARVKEAIMSYIQINTSSEGAFAVEDTVENRTRRLNFGYVHDSVHETEDGLYYACVDFTESRPSREDTLDLDFYVTLDPDGKPAVSKMVIHEVNGKSRL
jgi:hypothetical protein